MPMPHDDGLVNDETPIPPRYWWLKRIALAALALIVFLAGARLWIGRGAKRRFGI